MNFSEYFKKREAESNEAWTGQNVYPPAPFTGDKWVPRKSSLNIAGLVKTQTGNDAAGQESLIDRLKQIGKTASILFWTPSTIKWAKENLPNAKKWSERQIKDLKRMNQQNKLKEKDAQGYEKNT
jgi:hypothetical protein